jgi:hypothetical protein
MMNFKEVLTMSFKTIKDFISSETGGDILLFLGFCLLVVLLIMPFIRSSIALQTVQCCALLSPYLFTAGKR